MAKTPRKKTGVPSSKQGIPKSKTRRITKAKGKGPMGNLLSKFVPAKIHNMPVEDPPIWKIEFERMGRPPLIESNEQLMAIAAEYFAWVAANPLYSDKLVTYQGFATHEPEARKRLMSISGLCAFLGIVPATWYDWRKTRPDISDSIIKTELAIDRWNTEGAAADQLNAGFVARFMGLADKQEVTGKDGAPINPPAPAVDLSKFTDEELEAYRVVATAAERNRG